MGTAAGFKREELIGKYAVYSLSIANFTGLGFSHRFVGDPVNLSLTVLPLGSGGTI